MVLLDIPPRLGGFVLAMGLTKFILATSRRALYPFAPEVGRATGVSEHTVAGVLAIMQGCYCLVPIAVPWAVQRCGTDPILMGSAIVVAVAQLATGLGPFNFVGFTVAVGCFGIGKGLFDPVLQLKIRRLVPIAAQRGAVTSLVELSWGLSSLVGIPVSGLLLAQDLHLLFLVFGTLCAVASVMTVVQLRRTRLLMDAVELKDDAGDLSGSVGGGGGGGPAAAGAAAAVAAAAATTAATTTLTPPSSPSFRRSWGPVLAVWLGPFAACAGTDCLFLNWGVWLEEDHGLSVIQVATTTVVVGAADFTAELFLGWLLNVRKVPTPRLIKGSHLACVAAYLALPLLGRAGTGVGLVGGFLCIFAFEVRRPPQAAADTRPTRNSHTRGAAQTDDRRPTATTTTAH